MSFFMPSGAIDPPRTLEKKSTKAFFVRVFQAGLTLKSKRASVPEAGWKCKAPAKKRPSPEHKNVCKS
jgi:hypothetical protein